VYSLYSHGKIDHLKTIVVLLNTGISVDDVVNYSKIVCQEYEQEYVQEYAQRQAQQELVGSEEDYDSESSSGKSSKKSKH